MPTLLSAQRDLATAKAAFEKVKARDAKSKTRAAAAAALTKAYEALVAAYDAHPSMKAQRDEALTAKVVHHEKYEKKTVETADPPPASDADSTAASGPPASGADSEEDAPITQDSVAPSAKGGAPPKPKPKMGKPAGGEEDEERALVAAYKDGTRHYARSLRGQNIDAHGVLYGPQALLGACMKALGTKTVRETFGALAGLPEKLAASAEVAGRVEALERSQLKATVHAMVDKAKAEGRTRGSEDRRKLREFGMTRGAAELRGTLAMRDAKRTTAQGYHEPEEGTDGGRGQFAGSVSEEDMAIMTQGLAPDAAAMFRADFAKSLNGKSKAPAV